MRPSEQRQLAILQYLSQPSDDRSQQFDQLKTALSDRFSSEEIDLELLEMDSNHQSLLQLTLNSTLGENYVYVFSNETRFLTSKGDDRLYDLQHPEQSNLSNNTNYNFNGLITANGNQTFGNVENQIIQDSTDNSQTWNTDNSIHQLLDIKSQLSDANDQQDLTELATLLQQTLNSGETPKPGFLSKFGKFLDKTWKVTSPVVSPILVELAKRTFI